MGEPNFFHLVVLMLFSSLTLVAGLYLLAKFNTLFRGWIKNEWLRLNFRVWLIALCLSLAVTPTQPDYYKAVTSPLLIHYFEKLLLGITTQVLFVFNIAFLVYKVIAKLQISFRRRMTIILLTIIVACVSGAVLINLIANHGAFVGVQFTILYSFYTGCMTGLIYVTMNYVNLERAKKLDEKELEVSRLQALKTKAELDALHSKINPHFLYNALNSIADLSITDGKKARKMTVALADLFRYSINYTDNNYSTVKEEIEMAGVYLEIEKIRFEDRLTYKVNVEHEAEHYLVPRFVLQTVVENAVKHGLKATGQMTEINIDVIIKDKSLQLIVGDNGPDFPADLNPGYGIKSLYDKMDLLFAGQYAIHFTNTPRKQVLIQINKLMKNEHAV